MYYGDHFISTILPCLKVISFVLRAAIAYRLCTVKSHNGKSRCWQYKLQKSFRYEFVTSHWHLLRLHPRLVAYISVSTMLQENVKQLSKLLLTGNQFSSVRIAMECVVVLHGVPLPVS